MIEKIEFKKQIKTLNEYFKCIQRVRKYARRTRDDKLFEIVRFKGEKKLIE